MATRTKKQEKNFPDRVRFNWGYHDAVGDKAAGRARTTVSSGPQNPKTVSKEFDAAYYQGYQAGLEEQEYNGNSNEAWSRYEAEKKDLAEMRRDIERARDNSGNVRLC